MTRILEDLKERVEMSGYEPGTPEFEKELRREQVQLCMQMQDVGECQECARFSFCELRIAHWRDSRLNE